MIFEVTILGSSSALPTSQRYPAAHVINAHERFFLIDCGEGTQMQLRRNKIRMGKINNIFISHTHGDHIFGLYGLISTLNLTGRKKDLNIYAPESFGPILSSHLLDFGINLNFELNFVSLSGNDPKGIFEDKNITVSSIPLNHRVPTYGFIFQEKLKERNIIKELIKEYNLSLRDIVAIKRGEDYISDDGIVIPNKKLTSDPARPRSYAYCSDTAWFKRLSSMVKDVDLLYHESTFGSELEDLAKATGHSTARQAAMVARDAGAGRLLLGHFSARYKEVDKLVEEAREVFDACEAAEDNLTIAI